MAEVVSGLLLRVPSMAADLNLFKEEIGWKGEAGGNVRPLKAMVIWVIAMHPPPHPHHSPNQLQATTIWAPVVGRHDQVGGLPRWAIR